MKLFEPLAELELEKVFIKIIDALAEKNLMAVSDICEILTALTKEYPKESLFLLSEIAKRSKDAEIREYAVDVLSELALNLLKPTEKPEEPPAEEIVH